MSIARSRFVTGGSARRRCAPANEIHGAIMVEEYAVLDVAGRLQLPEHYVTALDLRRRVRLELEARSRRRVAGDESQ